MLSLHIFDFLFVRVITVSDKFNLFNFVFGDCDKCVKNDEFERVLWRPIFLDVSLMVGLKVQLVTSPNEEKEFSCMSSRL